MRFFLSGVGVDEILSVLSFFLVFLAVPTVIAWVWCIVMCRRSSQPIPFARAFIGVIASFLICFATLSWSTQGRNYSVLQVVISGALMVALTAVLVYRGHPRNPVSIIVWWAVVFGYSLGWSVISGPSDSTGLWGAGLLFLCLGLAFGLVLVIIITQIIAVHRESRHNP